MLVLKRRPDEEFTIDTGNGVVTVRLIRIDGQQAHIGIEAPNAMPILRDNARSTNRKQQGADDGARG